MNLEQKTIDVYKTWNNYGGYKATYEGMFKNIQLNWNNKKKIRELFLNGQDKISFFVDGSSEFDEVEAIFNINKYAHQQILNKKPLWATWMGLVQTPRSWWTNIMNNIISEYSVEYIVKIFNYRAVYGKEDIPSVFTDIAKQIKFTSPKLTQQVITIGKYFNVPQKIINEILSVFSIVQSFKINQTGTTKIVLSVDPTDFITCSVNDYHWTSCTAPDRDYSGMPISLMADYITAIAYIESTTSKLTLYNENEIAVNGPNKKFRQFIHFTDDYKGVLFNKTYPSPNLLLDETLFNFFSQFGFKPRTNNFEEVVERVEMTNAAIYNDIQASTIRFTGDLQKDITIGNEYYCVQCGELVDANIQYYGLCSNCVRKYEDIDEDEEEYYY